MWPPGPGDERVRCLWAQVDPLYVQYHDTEWGTPERDDRRIFAHLCLEVFQCGLSWLLVLRRREALSRALFDFSPQALGAMDEGAVRAVMSEPGMIQSFGKLMGIVHNARCLLRMWDMGLSLSQEVWSLVGGVTMVNQRRIGEPLPGFTQESAALSRRLKEVGFKFVGPTVCYSLMQAVGAVDDHAVECFRHSFNRQKVSRV